MRVLVLGSGGNTPIPTPTCRCAVCKQARSEGVPYARGGNSLYLPESAALIDAPEFAFRALNRERVEALEYILLTHWHPDHVNGLRLVQSRDLSAHDGLLDAVAAGGPTLVTTEAVYERTREVFGQIDHFRQQGFFDVTFLDDGPLRIDGTTVRSIPYALEGEEEDATAFEITRGEQTVLIASDDSRYLEEDRLPEEIDLAVFECGYFERGPDGERILTEADLSFLADELGHEEVMARIDRLDPDRTLLTEIEHFTARSHDHFAELASTDGYEGVEFAHDGLEIEI
ncbi:MBL fold metallo-hydrolase [Halovenus sp. WSH3]|uniref:MBL fold metallo-hydrolase n=1 Tax=Halovenus carboxidivorans TaxID=2692199 RepID=A0A6B0T4A6_9EURY|nr:MBL fold metallo-hydrolase [Halovenus carboxidivorans]MXR50041.1 MBL fold metallo-hydrolase [Halovenus carboxidivorans]